MADSAVTTVPRSPPIWRARLVGRAQAHVQGVQGRQPDRPGGRAHLLRRARDLPGADRARVDPRARGRVRDAAADRQPRHRRPRPRQGDLHQRDQEPPGRPGRRRRAVRGRPARRALVGLGLRRGLHARLERDLRHARRAGRSGRRSRCASASRSSCWSCSPSPRRGGVHGRAGPEGRRRDRPRQHRGHRLEHREVARATARGQLHVRAPLLGGPERQAARLPLDLARAASSRWSAG